MALFCNKFDVVGVHYCRQIFLLEVTNKGYWIRIIKNRNFNLADCVTSWKNSDLFDALRMRIMGHLITSFSFNLVLIGQTATIFKMLVKKKNFNNVYVLMS